METSTKLLDQGSELRGSSSSSSKFLSVGVPHAQSLDLFSSPSTLTL